MPFSAATSVTRLPAGGPQQLATGLGQHVVAVDRVPVVLGEPLRTVLATGLLVGHAEEHKRPLGREPGVREVACRHGHGCGEAEHVDRTAPPDLAVDEFATERVLAPAVGERRHDVGVPHEAHRRCVGVAALDAGDDRVAALHCGEPFDLQPGSFEHAGEEVGVARLLTALPRAVVDAGVADQVLQQLGGLVRERVVHGQSPNIGRVLATSWTRMSGRAVSTLPSARLNARMWSLARCAASASSSSHSSWMWMTVSSSMSHAKR